MPLNWADQMASHKFELLEHEGKMLAAALTQAAMQRCNAANGQGRNGKVLHRSRHTPHRRFLIRGSICGVADVILVGGAQLFVVDLQDAPQLPDSSAIVPVLQSSSDPHRAKSTRVSHGARSSVPTGLRLPPGVTQTVKTQLAVR